MSNQDLPPQLQHISAADLGLLQRELDTAEEREVLQSVDTRLGATVQLIRCAVHLSAALEHLGVQELEFFRISWESADGRDSLSHAGNQASAEASLADQVALLGGALPADEK